MAQQSPYLSTDPHAGEPVDDYLSTDPSAGTKADFSVANAVDANGHSVVGDAVSSLGTLAGHVWQQMNPITAVKAVGEVARDPRAAVKQIGAAQGALFDKAKAAYQKGDYVTAGRHFVDYLLPLIGPAIDQSADAMQRGEYAAGAGDAIGLGLAMFGPESLRSVGVAKKRPKTPTNPVQAAAVAFAREKGIPVDAATATGSPYVRRLQTAAANVPMGAGVAEDAIATQQQALAWAGSRLADRVHTASMTPETAGASLKSTVEGTIRQLDEQATAAYGKLRAMEADPANAIDVPKQRPPSVQREIDARTNSTLGHLPKPAELEEMRRIAEELDNLRFTKRTWRDLSGEHGLRGNAAGGHMEVIAGSGGAPVYHDILEHSPGVSSLTRAEVQRSIESALETGQYTNAAKGALSVARQRLARGGVSGAPYSAPPTQSMLMPVDLRPFKAAMKSTHEELLRAAEITPPMGDKGRALVALDKVMRGPDFAPVSVADSALSDLKSMARGASMPELRTSGQGTAAYAVKNLERQVQEAVERAGPDAVAALKEGRSATRAKWEAASVYETIGDEPVKAFNSAVLRKDSGIARLRQLSELAPMEMEKIGRAWLDDALQAMTKEGGFEKARTLKTSWDNLGPQTRRLLYGDELSSELDKFFRVATKMAENPNPSGTAYQLNATKLTAALPGYVMAKVFYTPKGVRLVQQVLTLPAASVGAKVALGRLVEFAKRMEQAGAPLRTVLQPAQGQ